MFNRFPKESKQVVVDARGLAQEAGSATVDAEHVLLALARQTGTAAERVLAHAGLDEHGLRRALDAEEERSLAAVGVSAAAFELPPAPRGRRTPRWGASAKVALERALKVAEGRRDRRIEPGHILVAVLRAPTGRVPRALEQAGIDRVELAGRMEAALG